MAKGRNKAEEKGAQRRSKTLRRCGARLGCVAVAVLCSAEVPSSRTFWCLLVEACLSDDAKTITQLAQQLEDEILGRSEIFMPS